MRGFAAASDNTAFPQLCQYECGWGAAGIPERYTTAGGEHIKISWEV